MGWSRFATPGIMAGLIVLMVVVSMVNAWRPEPRTRGQAVEVAHRVAQTAFEIVDLKARALP